jgi:hypothetical protein
MAWLDRMRVEKHLSEKALAEALYEASDPDGVPWPRPTGVMREPFDSPCRVSNIGAEKGLVATISQHVCEAELGKVPAAQDVAAELWSCFEDFLERWGAPHRGVDCLPLTAGRSSRCSPISGPEEGKPVTKPAATRQVSFSIY